MSNTEGDDVKIRVERDALADAVAWVARSLPNRPTAPILAGLLMNASGDEVTLSSFDSTTSAQVTMPAEVTDEGTVLVSGRLLNEIARSLPNKPVDMTADHSQVELTCGSARFSLQTLPVDEYPTLPEMPTQTGLVDASVFEKSVSQVVIAAGRDELLNVFTGVRVEINGDQLSLLATDRYRMALKELTWQPSSPDIEGAGTAGGHYPAAEPGLPEGPALDGCRRHRDRACTHRRPAGCCQARLACRGAQHTVADDHRGRPHCP